MDPFADNIAKIIEEEVERRVNERVAPLLQYVSDRYNVRMKHLIKIMDNVKYTHCMAVTKNGKMCQNKPKYNGYCHLHKGLHVHKGKSPEAVRHTHSLPPLFLKGCPACERGKPLRDLVDCFGNNDEI